MKNIDPRGPDRCPPHRIPWERGRDARMLFLWRLLSFPAMLQAVILSAPHRPGRNKAMAPFPVDSSKGDGRGCAWLCAGGTPALPGSTHLMTSPHQGHHPAEAVWRRLSMEEVHLHSCLFVSIRGSSSLTISRFSSNDPPTRKRPDLPESAVVFTILWNGAEPSRRHRDEQ